MPFDRGGTVLTGDALVQHAQRNGLCPVCGATKTHDIVRKMFSRKLVPKEEVRDSMGNLVVYKGFCLLPRCHSLQDVQLKFGEVPAKLTSGCSEISSTGCSHKPQKQVSNENPSSKTC